MLLTLSSCPILHGRPRPAERACMRDRRAGTTRQIAGPMSKPGCAIHSSNALFHSVDSATVSITFHTLTTHHGS